MLARTVAVPIPTWAILAVVRLAVFAGVALWYHFGSRPDKGE